eukprot:CAMPEP_0177652134 /NCGR_PEP_ID=MMETSP0447-20121125/12944_1 /TAXON_ID=0 /ORGANISM="Stygamoeba regulata, Strain BSH-02190019" /LENGTH=479 /DNA_ID=CAMNT_0019155311 /DNA_START=127 /DNA_END=1566 /DNA_ORIENTATION=-
MEARQSTPSLMSRNPLYQVSEDERPNSVVVVGGGLVGVTTAYYLARAGFQVQVLEKRKNVCDTTTVGDAGALRLVSSETFARPSSVFAALRSLLGLPALRDVPGEEENDYVNFDRACLRDSQFASWAWTFVKKSFSSGRAERDLAMRRLIYASHGLFLSLIEEEKMAVPVTQGSLEIYRNHQSLMTALENARVRSIEHKIPFEVLQPDELYAAHPYLRNSSLPTEALSGAIYYPKDVSVDSTLFVKEMERICREKYNVQFHYNTTMKNVVVEEDRVVGVQTHQKHCCRPEFENADGSASARLFTADAYVFCVGAQASSEEMPPSLSLPVYPVKSYSMTAPTLASALKYKPTSLLLDNERRVYYTPLSESLRASSVAEFSPHPEPTQEIVSSLYQVASKTLPLAAQWEKSQMWRGVRPVSADGLPIVSRTPLQNAFLNAGHGSGAFRTALGSGYAISSILSGSGHTTRGVPLAPLHMERF